MDTLRGLFRRDLSRVSYALLVGVVSAVAVFAVRLPGAGSFGAVAMGITMAVAYYALDPNNKN